MSGDPADGAGQPVPLVDVDHPYTHLAAGRWREAAAAWERAECPYERALALSFSADTTELLTALSILDGLGAAPLARVVRERLRDLGVARIPRGPAPSTRDNPLGLTDRQVEVLRLLASGLTNAEIAGVLGVSESNAGTRVHRAVTKLREACA